MTTYTGQRAISRRHSGTTAWASHHPVISTLAALAAAVLAGALIGILFSVALSGIPAVPQHRAGGHAMATVVTAQHAASVAAQRRIATQCEGDRRQKSGARRLRRRPHDRRRQRCHRHPPRDACSGSWRIPRPFAGSRPRAGDGPHEAHRVGKLSPQETRRRPTSRGRSRRPGVPARTRSRRGRVSPPGSAGTRTPRPARPRARRGRTRSRAGTRAPRRRPRPA